MTKRKIYVASSSSTSEAAKPSGRNEYYPKVVARLRETGHEVYDFRRSTFGRLQGKNPPSGNPGFKWSSVSEDCKAEEFKRC